MTITKIKIALAMVSMASVCTGRALSQTSNPDLIGQAKKEGRVTWYTTVSIPESKQLIDIFEKQYPFIKVDLLRSGSGALVNRVLSEYAAKNYSADVLQGTATRGGLRRFWAVSAISARLSRSSASPFKAPFSCLVFQKR